MKLDGLRIFREYLIKEADDAFVPAGFFYYKDEGWADLVSNNVIGESETDYIAKAKKEIVCYHASSSTKAWFYLSKFNAAVCLKFRKSPQKNTRQKAREHIDRVQEAAVNAYKVNYNQLTLLLARDAFRERILASIKNSAVKASSSVDAQDGDLPRIFAIFALDIDHFKQINDTWGHLYGDLVLKAFGLRLEKCAVAIRGRAVDSPDIFLGHPSGEEFLVLIEASASKEQFLEWANEFRRSVAEEGLPSDPDVQLLEREGRNSEQRLPPLHERTVTASIGLAFHNATTQGEDFIEAVTDLLEKADTALYRAKASGRNQAISYEEILNRYGRVIEQNEIAKIVAIDIGTKVGVEVGQEFRVFLPTFCGKEKFYINDGRTKRVLGNYPRVESARIVVFNAQPELSFAYIESPETPIVLDVGSHLEAIPAGSIGHLLPSSKASKYFSSSSGTAGVGGVKALQEFIDNNEAALPFSIVVRFAKGAEYMRKHGTVALNMALAQLYREVQLEFHAAGGIEVIDKDSICIVGVNESYRDAQVNTFTNSMAAVFPELNVVTGGFCDEDRVKSGNPLQLELNASHAIEFARFAAVDAGRLPDNRVRHFSYEVVYTVLQSLRTSQLYDTAYADFKRLRKLGVDSPIISNLGGVIASTLGLNQDALECYANAIAKDPDKVIYKSNYGTVAYLFDETDSALKILNGVSYADLDFMKKVHEYGYFGYARLLAKAYLNKSLMFDKERFLYVADNALSLTQYKNTAGYNSIYKVLSEIRSGEL